MWTFEQQYKYQQKLKQQQDDEEFADRAPKLMKKYGIDLKTLTKADYETDAQGNEYHYDWMETEDWV